MVSQTDCATFAPSLLGGNAGVLPAAAHFPFLCPGLCAVVTEIGPRAGLLNSPRVIRWARSPHLSHLTRSLNCTPILDPLCKVSKQSQVWRRRTMSFWGAIILSTIVLKYLCQENKFPIQKEKEHHTNQKNLQEKIVPIIHCF